jgi:pentatricopeptide repeat protein
MSHDTRNLKGVAVLALTVVSLLGLAGAWKCQATHSPFHWHLTSDIQTASANSDGGARSSERMQAVARILLREAQQQHDVDLHYQAMLTLDHALTLYRDPVLLGLQAMALAGLHRFDEAIVSARAALERAPLDLNAYSALADSLVELGRYDEAVETVEQMLSVKPTAAGYARAAHLRALYGDQRGGLDAMRLALDATPAHAVIDRAWMLAHVGHDALAAGNEAAAERAYREALALVPTQEKAREGMAALQAARGNYLAAIETYRSLTRAGDAPDVQMALGDICTVLDRSAEAARHYELAEIQVRAELQGPGTPERRRLALFYADRGIRLEESLALARADAVERDDVYAADALAWTLFQSGRVTEALAAVRRALRLGTQDPLLLYHAGAIATDAGERGDAVHWLDAAIARPALLGPRRVAHARELRARLGA